MFLPCSIKNAVAHLSYVNGVFQTGFCILVSGGLERGGWRGVGEGLGKGWGRVGEGVGAGLGKGWGGLGFLYFKNPV